MFELKYLPTEIILTLSQNLRSASCTSYAIASSKFDLYKSILALNSHSQLDRYAYLISVTWEDKSSNFFKISLVKRPVQESYFERKLDAYVWIDIRDSAIYFFADAPLDTLNAVLHNFIDDHFYKELNRCYVTSQELRDSINYLQSKEKYSFSSKWWTAKEKFGSEIKFEKTLVPALECFNLAKHRNASVNWIRLHVDTPDKKQFKLDISREGNVYVSEIKNLGVAFFFMNAFFSISKAQSVFLEDRNLTEKSPPKPVQLLYSEEVFKAHINRGTLIKKMREYKDVSYSVIHGVNPHVYILITDTKDFSSFTLRTLRTNSILIIPHSYATSGAMGRFIHFLNENFEEYSEMKELEITQD